MFIAVPRPVLPTGPLHRTRQSTGRRTTSRRSLGIARLLVLSALTALSTLVLGAAPGWAHADLVSSTPAQGVRVAELPPHAVLTFSEDMQSPAYVVVRDAHGRAVATGKARVDGAKVLQRLDGHGSSPGRYTMAYRAISADGHPVSGQISFTVTGGRPAASGTSTSEPPSAGAQDTRPASPHRHDHHHGHHDQHDHHAAQAGHGFWAEHGTHVLIAVLLLLLATGLLWVSRRRET